MRICIIPFASTILIGGLFQSLSLRIFAFALCSTSRGSPPAHPRQGGFRRHRVLTTTRTRRSLKLRLPSLFLAASPPRPSPSAFPSPFCNLLSAFTLSSLSPSRVTDHVEQSAASLLLFDSCSAWTIRFSPFFLFFSSALYYSTLFFSFCVIVNIDFAHKAIAGCISICSTRV